MKHDINLLIENKVIIFSLGNLNYQISREKFEPEPGFEPRISGFLARRSTTSAILVLMPAHAQISLLRRRNPEVLSSNPGSGLNFCLEI